MSYQGQAWVDEVAFPHLKNSGELLVMLRVANHAGNGPAKMSGCFASSLSIAAECLLKPRAVQEHLRNLADRGLLVPGDPKLVAYIRADRRPPVHDLGGAHVSGCPGGHDIDGECCPLGTGSKNHHPLGDEQNPRSAGSRFGYPSSGTPATGSKKRPPRVANFATKSSKELKEFSLSSGAPSPGAAPEAPTAPTDEREDAARNDKTNPVPPLPAQREALPTGPDVDKVSGAYIGACLTAAGLPPNNTSIRRVREAAAGLLAAGRSVDNLVKLAAELAEHGWDDLAKHALKNPEPKNRPRQAKPWCGQCDDPGYRWVQVGGGWRQCVACNPDYTPVPATV